MPFLTQTAFWQAFTKACEKEKKVYLKILYGKIMRAGSPIDPTNVAITTIIAVCTEKSALYLPDSPFGICI